MLVNNTHRWSSYLRPFGPLEYPHWIEWLRFDGVGLNDLEQLWEKRPIYFFVKCHTNGLRPRPVPPAWILLLFIIACVLFHNFFSVLLVFGSFFCQVLFIVSFMYLTTGSKPNGLQTP